MKVHTFTGDVEVNKLSQLRLVTHALKDFLDIFVTACEGKRIPEDCTVRIEVEKHAFTTKSIFSTILLVRLICPQVGSYAVRISHSRYSRAESNIFPMFFIVGDEEPEPLTPLKIYDTVFGQALEKLPVSV